MIASGHAYPKQNSSKQTNAALVTESDNDVLLREARANDHADCEREPHANAKNRDFLRTPWRLLRPSSSDWMG